MHRITTTEEPNIDIKHVTDCLGGKLLRPMIQKLAEHEYIGEKEKDIEEMAEAMHNFLLRVYNAALKYLSEEEREEVKRGLKMLCIASLQDLLRAKEEERLDRLAEPFRHPL